MRSAATTPAAFPPDGDRSLSRSGADHCALSAASLVELSIVIEARYGSDGQGDLDLFLSTAQISIVSLDREQTEIARAAFAQYGKGRHRASLNLGDCFSMPWPSGSNNPCCSKVMISATPISSQPAL